MRARRAAARSRRGRLGLRRRSCGSFASARAGITLGRAQDPDAHARPWPLRRRRDRVGGAAHRRTRHLPRRGVDLLVHRASRRPGVGRHRSTNGYAANRELDRRLTRATRRPRRDRRERGASVRGRTRRDRVSPPPLDTRSCSTGASWSAARNGVRRRPASAGKPAARAGPRPARRLPAARPRGACRERVVGSSCRPPMPRGISASIRRSNGGRPRSPRRFPAFVDSRRCPRPDD